MDPDDWFAIHRTVCPAATIRIKTDGGGRFYFECGTCCDNERGKSVKSLHDIIREVDEIKSGYCDAANAVVLPGVFQFKSWDAELAENCSRCGKHVSTHYGGTQYRCYPLRGGDEMLFKTPLVKQGRAKTSELVERMARAEPAVDRAVKSRLRELEPLADDSYARALTFGRAPNDPK